MIKKALSGIALASLLISQANAQPKWEQKLDSDIRFKMVHDSGLNVDERFGTLVNVEKKKTIQIYDMN